MSERPYPSRAQRRELIRQMIADRGLTLETMPNGHSRITGRGIDLRVVDLAAVHENDLKSPKGW